MTQEIKHSELLELCKYLVPYFEYRKGGWARDGHSAFSDDVILERLQQAIKNAEAQGARDERFK
jgi:hypothetical protein